MLVRNSGPTFAVLGTDTCTPPRYQNKGLKKKTEGNVEIRVYRRETIF